jgi:hypothetical protein
MPTHLFMPVLVTGINGHEGAQIVAAHTRALELFETGLVSPLSPIGHNFVQSFCVFPSGGGQGRPALAAHRSAVDAFCKWLETTNLDFFAASWQDGERPTITHSHDGPDI